MQENISKVKVLDDLESHLSFIYDVYLKEKDENLDVTALELKRHYEYVFCDLILHDGIEVIENGKSDI